MQEKYFANIQILKHNIKSKKVAKRHEILHYIIKSNLENELENKIVERMFI